MLGFFRKVAGRVRGPVDGLRRLLLPAAIDENSVVEVENMLLSADIGSAVAAEIVGKMREEIRTNRELRRERMVDIAAAVLRENLAGAEGKFDGESGKLQVICLVGGNGSGKTTTAAKLANFCGKRGQRVVLGACDTFRAAGGEQLVNWGQRLSVDVIAGQRGADPAAVAFDAYRAAAARGADVLILDTAGRLHGKVDLMAELQKILRTLKRIGGEIVPRVWLVADGTLGTNTLESAQAFHGEIGLDGLIVTKLDGTSSGGPLVGIYKRLAIPIFFIGTGETPDSLQPFSVDDFVGKLFADG